MIDVKTLVLMRSEGMKVMMRKLGFDEFLGAAGEHPRFFRVSETMRRRDPVRRSARRWHERVGLSARTRRGTAQIASHPRSGQVPFDRVDRHLVP